VRWEESARIPKAERALTVGQRTLAAERQLPANYLKVGKAAERVACSQPSRSGRIADGFYGCSLRMWAIPTYDRSPSSISLTRRT
jgi:hypothetical protein